MAPVGRPDIVRLVTRLRTAFAAAIVCLGGANVARADTATDRQLAQSLFDSARAAMQKGDFKKACPLFQESQKLDPGGGTLLNLAVCHENEGCLHTAMVEFNDALSQAIKESRKDREKTAREHIAALTPRLPKLILKSALELPSNATLEIDGSPVTLHVVGVPMPLDPGDHRVKLSVPGNTPWESTAILRERETNEITLPEFLPAIAVYDAARQPGPAKASDAPVYHLPPEPSTPPATQLSTGFWIVGGLSLASFGVSAVTGFMALNKQSSYRNACTVDRSFCADSSAVDDADSARTLAWVSTGTLGGGIVLGLIALTLPRVRVPVSAAPSRDGAVVSYEASF